MENCNDLKIVGQNGTLGKWQRWFAFSRVLRLRSYVEWYIGPETISPARTLDFPELQLLIFLIGLSGCNVRSGPLVSLSLKRGNIYTSILEQ